MPRAFFLSFALFSSSTPDFRRQTWVAFIAAVLPVCALAQSVPLRLERELGQGRAALPAQREALPTFVAADHVSGEVDERTVFAGHAEVRKGGTVLRADRIDYTARTDTLVATGNARLFGDGLVMRGPQLDLKLDAQTGRMNDAQYDYAPRNGRGVARVFELLGEGRARLTEATYTTCSPDDQAWWVQAERLDIDRDEELATARNVRLYFGGVPVLASPYFQMPLGDRRRSGVLTPSFGINSRLGPEATVPVYWNIAPNRDLTLAPRVMSRRGVLLQSEFRYLEPTWRGSLEYDAIGRDRDFGQGRERVSWRHENAFLGVLGGNAGAGVNFNRVSDDRYFVDFGRNIVSASQAVLPQEAWATYTRGVWTSALRQSQSQTLVGLLMPGEQPPYERVPQWTANANVFDWQGWDVALGLELTRFEQRTLLPGASSGREPGTRFIANPSVSYPLLAPGWFVVPKVQLHSTDYALSAQRRPDNDRMSRRVPISSIDTGLIFERDARWFGAEATQTLEPRLYYSYIPYREQSMLPNFDSGLADFNFAQLFTENVFVGGDRIGEANQLTAAMVGRVLENDSGAERLRIALGQRYFFSPQRVVLPGGVPRTDKESDVLGSVMGVLDKNWTADVSVQHSTLQKQVVRASAGLRYRPRPASVLSLAYRYKLKELDQIDLAAQWPLKFIGLPRWYGVMRVNYSKRDAQVVEAVGGLEYKADCWVTRVVMQRFVAADRKGTNTVYFQVELNGLSSVGSSPVESLRRNIPGYQLINPPPPQPGRYHDYE